VIVVDKVIHRNLGSCGGDGDGIAGEFTDLCHQLEDIGLSAHIGAGDKVGGLAEKSIVVADTPDFGLLGQA
jgi:hypothetical protein